MLYNIIQYGKGGELNGYIIWQGIHKERINETNR